MGQMIQYKTPDGKSCPGYLAVPGQGDAAPGVVVIQEWWGLNPNIQRVADRFAQAGYRALVPDLYRGRVTQEPDEANHLMTGLDWAGATHQDIRGAVQYLKAKGGKAAVMGFCMGGALTIMAGVHVPEADVGVCFYGIPPAKSADPAKIRFPIQCHFAELDDWCTPAAVNALEKTLKAAQVTHEIFRYRAHHAFCNEARPEVYDAKAAQESWGRMLTFLSKHL